MQPTKRPTGKVQRLILDELEGAIADRGGDAYLTSDSLAWRLRAVDLGLDPGDDLPPGQEPSRSDYVSVCRAARELARRGLVSIDKRTHRNQRDRSAFLWIAAPGSGLEDERRPGLAETVSRLVAPAIEDALTGDSPRGSKSVGCPAGHVSYRWLAKTLALAVGDKSGRFSHAIRRGIDKAEERGEIRIRRDYRHGATGWSDRRVCSFVALSYASSTRQQTDETARSVR